MESMKAELEKAEAELQEKATELNKLREELDTLRQDSEVCVHGVMLILIDHCCHRKCMAYIL